MAVCEYELQRDARIKRNKERLQELNLPSLFDAFHASMQRQKTKRVRQAKQVGDSMLPLEQRRSSRLANVEPVEYAEAILAQADAACDQTHPRVRSRCEEVYTSKHVEALGDCKEEWPLFQDGYDAQGNRQYSKETGQTCHQCRQKTLGLRTACSSCSSLKGVFCGDCLFMRYGENVKEANANPNWTCPDCRGICNCSIHRIRQGLAPTGSLFRRATARGFKSVAHYLILNNLAKPEEQAQTRPDAEAVAPPAEDEAAAAEGASDAILPAACETAKRPQTRQKQITDMLQPHKKQKLSAKAKGPKAGASGAEKAADCPPERPRTGLGRLTRSTAARV